MIKFYCFHQDNLHAELAASESEMSSVEKNKCLPPENNSRFERTGLSVTKPALVVAPCTHTPSLHQRGAERQGEY